MSVPMRRILFTLLGLAVIAAVWMAMRGDPAATTTSPDGSEPSTAIDGNKVPPSPASGTKRPRPEQDASEDDEPFVPERIARWMEQAKPNPAGTLGKILTLEDEDERREALDAVLVEWLETDREAVLEWLKLSLPRLEGSVTRDLLDIVIGSWGAEEPLQTVDWVNGNLPEPGKSEALKTVAEVWSQADPEGMESWILQQAQPPVFWTGQLIQGYIPSDPAKAMEWSERLPDPAAVEAAKQNVIQSWLLNDPEGANAYLKAHPELVPEVLPEEPPPP